jgi:hypothetical protein
MLDRKTLARALAVAAVLAAAPVVQASTGGSAAPETSAAASQTGSSPSTTSAPISAEAVRRNALIRSRIKTLHGLQRTHNQLVMRLRKLSGHHVQRANPLARASGFTEPGDVLNANRKLRVKIRSLRSRIAYYETGDGYWIARQRAIPDALKARLATLRGCETRGIAYPANYQYRGAYRGAYQYDYTTWREAGGSGDPADASPAEQDVRTAAFYPGHEGRWGCKA